MPLGKGCGPCRANIKSNQIDIAKYNSKSISLLALAVQSSIFQDLALHLER